MNEQRWLIQLVNRLKQSIKSRAHTVREMNIMYRHTSQLQTLREAHERALDDLNKEKELLSAQFDFERNQDRAEHNRTINEITTALNEKVQI
jgi:hypothetical protein